MCIKDYYKILTRSFAEANSTSFLMAQLLLFLASMTRAIVFLMDPWGDYGVLGSPLFASIMKLLFMLI